MNVAIASHSIEQRRRIILDAAVRVFERAGLDGASMRKVASEAGVTTGAIYPLFDGKEAIYGALLAESLERLQLAVAGAAATEAAGPMALKAAAIAFYDYYRKRLFEFELGLYLLRGFEHRGLGKAWDRQLNTSLERSLEVMRVSILRAAPNSFEGDAKPQRDALFAQLIGVLVLEHSGRARSIGTSSHRVLESLLDGFQASLDAQTATNRTPS